MPQARAPRREQERAGSRESRVSCDALSERPRRNASRSPVIRAYLSPRGRRRKVKGDRGPRRARALSAIIYAIAEIAGRGRLRVRRRGGLLDRRFRVFRDMMRARAVLLGHQGPRIVFRVDRWECAGFILCMEVELGVLLLGEFGGCMV